jgi:hypothetical protein
MLIAPVVGSDQVEQLKSIRKVCLWPEAYIMAINTPTILCPSVSQNTQHWKLLMLEEGQNPIIEYVS